MSEKVAQQVQNTTSKLQKEIKSKIFDILAMIILVALVALSLGIIERRIITIEEIGNIIVECIPFFLAAMLLNNNYYMKGTFDGKNTENFKAACLEYSKRIEKLDGEQIDSLDEFCEEFNNEALIKKQKSYLNRASISYELFNDGKETNDNKIHDPIKTWSYHKLVHTYGKERAKWIIRARKTNIKGLRVNSLMGTNDNDDITDIGDTETQLAKKRLGFSAVSYAFSTLIMALIAVKDVKEWGWFGIALVLFKCIFILVKSYMSYFDGYNDITIHLVHHTNRKTDILKQFEYWYGNKLKKS